MWQPLFTVSALVASAFAAPTSNHVLHEKRETRLPHVRTRVDPDSIIPIRIALRQSNLESGYERMMGVSHPTSESYGKHLSAEEVHDIFAPSDDTVQIVKDWLLDSGLGEADIRHYDNKAWLAVDMPAAHAGKLLRTEYFEHESSTSTRIGCDEYHLPAHVSEHVDLIKPGVKLSSPLKKRTVKRGEDGWPGHGWPGPSHTHPNPYPHWHMPPGAHGLPPDLRACGVNIT